MRALSPFQVLYLLEGCSFTPSQLLNAAGHTTLDLTLQSDTVLAANEQKRVLKLSNEPITSTVNEKGETLAGRRCLMAPVCQLLQPFLPHLYNSLSSCRALESFK